MRQAGTWGPLLQCSHLDKCLLQEQNKRNYKGPKVSMYMCSWGQMMNKKIQKDQNCNFHFWSARSKSRESARDLCMKHHQEGQHTTYASPPGRPINPLPCSPHFRDHFASPRGASCTCYWILLPCVAAGVPVKSCLNSSPGLLSISVHQRVQERGPVTLRCSSSMVLDLDKICLTLWGSSGSIACVLVMYRALGDHFPLVS